jgi:hypothetical protein
VHGDVVWTDGSPQDAAGVWAVDDLVVDLQQVRDGGPR